MMEKHLPSFLLSVITAVALWVGHSINELNRNVEKVLTQTSSHEKRLDKLERKVFQ